MWHVAVHCQQKTIRNGGEKRRWRWGGPLAKGSVFAVPQNADLEAELKKELLLHFSREK